MTYQLAMNLFFLESDDFDGFYNLLIINNYSNGFGGGLFTHGSDVNYSNCKIK